jgi:predicted dehydrogenase
MTAAQTLSKPASPPDTDRKLRMAFIGAGGIANAHLVALQKMADVEVVALSDVSQKSMEDKAEKFNIPRDNLYTDYEKMLDEVKPDAVDICTPNGLHAPNALASLKAGAHVIVEKPMAMNAREAKQMIDAARKADRKLVIGFQYRYDPKTQFLKQAADDGLLGNVMFGRVQALRRRGIPNWGVFGRKDLQGGGPMIDIGVHVLEMCHYVMGSPKPVAAVGMTRTYLGDKPSDQIKSSWAGWDYKTYTVEDIAVGHIRFENGAVIHIEAMFAGHIEKDVWDFQLMGEKGGCTWSEPKVFTDNHGHMLNIAPGWLPGHQFAGFFDVKLRNFVDHVLYDKPTGAPAEHGLMVQQMLDGIYESASQGGKEVAISSLM